MSIRKIAAAAELGPDAGTRDRPRRGHRQSRCCAGCAALAVRLAGTGSPDGSYDDELAGRELIAERLGDEVEWLHECTNWLAQLELGEYPPVINLRPEADHPERCDIVVDVGRVRRVLLRIAADIDELARAGSVDELEQAEVDRDVRADRRRRLAESHRLDRDIYPPENGKY